MTRQAVSQRLIAAGHSPAAREEERRAGSATSQYRRQRAERIETRAKMRTERIERLLAECAAWNVKPHTLAQYVDSKGPYRYAETANPEHGRYGRGKLPNRHSPDGIEVAGIIRDVCSPWSVTTISRLAPAHASKETT